MVDDIVLQCGRVLTVLWSSSLLHGFIVTMEERVPRGQGPSIIQPYRDHWKLFHKTLLIPESASWVFFWAPVVAFSAMLIVPMLIPVLTISYDIYLIDEARILEYFGPLPAFLYRLSASRGWSGTRARSMLMSGYGCLLFLMVFFICNMKE